MNAHARHSLNRRIHRHLRPCLLALFWILLPRPAHAWHQYFTSTGAPMHWPAAARSALPYSIDATGLASDGLSNAAVFAAVDSAFTRWPLVACPVCKATAQAGPCTKDQSCSERPLDVHFVSLGWHPPASIGLSCAPTDSGPCDYEPDGNQVLFIHEAKAWPFGSLVIAMTVVSALPKTGDIADADIALNDAGFAFCLDACVAGQVHLGAVILHEAGHFLGLDHSEQPDAVMFAKPPAQITAMGELTADDKAGICAIYPVDVTATCPPAAQDAAGGRAGTGSCSAAPAPTDAAVLAALTALVVLALRRRATTSARPTCRPQA